MPRRTQIQIKGDILSGLRDRYWGLGWTFKEMKIPGIKHVIRGDNKRRDLHFTFAIPMLLIQEANMDYWTCLDYKIFRPIAEMMRQAPVNDLVATNSGADDE